MAKMTCDCGEWLSNSEFIQAIDFIKINNCAII